MKQLITKEYVQSLLRPLSTSDYKGSNGHALLIAGSYGMMGAAVLATNAALRSGAGLVTSYVPSKGVEVLQIAAPQAMIIADAFPEFIHTISFSKSFDAIGIGPGLGSNKATQNAIIHFISNCEQSLVIDADALNCIAANSFQFKLIPEGSILTPHLGEFKRLVGSWKTDKEKFKKLQQLSKSTKSVVVLKGAGSCIACPDKALIFNTTGNEGMAKGGSGDVLTGVLTALLAKGYSAYEAAIIGVFIHGKAGDLAAEELGKISMNAQDIINHLAKAFKQLE
jgi:NAD(P)H-hydrate epimerase